MRDTGSMDEVRSDVALIQESLVRPQAYKELIDRYSPRLLRYARRLGCVHEHDAKDIVQETFIKAYVNLRSFDTSLTFSSWIYRICHNEAMSWFRKQRIRPQPAPTEEDLRRLEEQDDGKDLLGEVQQRLRAERVQEALAKLDDVSREVLILRFFEERSYEEISDILRKPPGTVATLISRAKKKLREQLGTMDL